MRLFVLKIYHSTDHSKNIIINFKNELYITKFYQLLLLKTHVLHSVANRKKLMTMMAYHSFKEG